LVDISAGTGLLAVALGHLASHYVATDIPDFVPLIRKNIQLNHNLVIQSRKSVGSGSFGFGFVDAAPNVSTEPLDWLLVHDTPAPARHKLELELILFPPPPSASNQLDGPSLNPKHDHDHGHGTGLILVVDCIYHPSLIPPLLSTLDHLAARPSSLSSTQDHTHAHGPDVLVVAELRSEDVIREFLEGWRALEGWTIWSLNTGDVSGDSDDEDGLASFSARYGVWLGRKSSNWSSTRLE
jgi:hypothetical protein